MKKITPRKKNINVKKESAPVNSFLYEHPLPAGEKVRGEGEQRFLQLTEASFEGIVIHEMGRILEVNQNMADMFGYEKSELEGMSLMDLIAPQMRDLVLKNAQFDYQEIYEVTALKKDGGTLICELHGRKVSHQGRVARVLVLRDVTHRNQSEEQLHLQDAALKASANAIVITDRKGIINWANQAFGVLTGYDPSEAVGKNPRDLVKSGEHDRAFYKDMWNTILAEKVWRNEIVNRRKDGSLYSEEMTITPVLDPQGKFSHFIAVKQDITQRKQAEEKTLLQLKRLTALREIDLAIAATFGMNLSLNALVKHAINLLAVDAVTVLLFNSVMNTLEYGAGLGFRTDKVKTSSVKLGESYAGRAAIERHIVQIPNLAQEPDNLFLTGFLSGEGFVSYYGTPLIVKGKVIGVMEVFHRSLVERDEDWFGFFNTLAGQAAIAIDNAKLFENLQNKNIELEMRVEERTVELRKANRSKDEFLASMSHELRTPLNAVIGITEALEEGIYGELRPHQMEKLHIIAESGKHLLELINDILDISKIEAGKLELQAKPTAVDALCQASMRMVKQIAFQKSLQVSMLNTSNIEMIHADERRLKQMLVNLLSNAVKFTPEGGQIALEVSREGDHAIRFSVRDTGIGIPADQVGRLFKPFVQLDSSLSRQYTGTGLGLALTSQLAELHGGSMGVESEVGRGSCFYFIIPTQSPAARVVESEKSAAQIPNQTPVKHEGKKRRILLVEDNAINRMVANDYLSAKGYYVDTAADGFEAIESAQTYKPDLILMDIQMPGMNGFEAIKRLRATPETAAIPIIALTALAMPDDRERCLEAGASEYLAKPVSLKKMEEMIEGLLRVER